PCGSPPALLLPPTRTPGRTAPSARSPAGSPAAPPPATRPRGSPNPTGNLDGASLPGRDGLGGGIDTVHDRHPRHQGGANQGGGDQDLLQRDRAVLVPPPPKMGDEHRQASTQRVELGH